MIYCSYSKKRKHGEIAFLTSRYASKHVLFALGVNPTATCRYAGEGGGSDLVLQAMPFTVLYEASSRLPSLNKCTITSQDVKKKCCRVCH